MSTSNEKSNQVKFSSFNVSNLVDKLSEPDFVNYIKCFDVFCALETFTSAQFDFSTRFDEFCVFHKPAVKLSRRGRRSGGVAFFFLRTLMPFVTDIECDYDNLICVKFSKNLFGLD